MEKHANFVGEVKDAISILKSDLPVMNMVAQKQSATMWGVVIFVVPVVANLIISALIFPSGFSSIFSRFLFWPLVTPFLALILSIFLMAVFVDKVFKVKVSGIQLFRVLSYASIGLWLTVFAFLLDLIGILEASGIFNLIWIVGVGCIFYVAFRFLKDRFKLSDQDTGITVGFGIFVYLLGQVILGKILVGDFYRFFY